MTEKQILGFNPAPRLEHIAANIPTRAGLQTSL
jgi:hypothetical protein